MSARRHFAEARERATARCARVQNLSTYHTRSGDAMTASDTLWRFLFGGKRLRSRSSKISAWVVPWDQPKSDSSRMDRRRTEPPFVRHDDTWPPCRSGQGRSRPRQTRNEKLGILTRRSQISCVFAGIEAAPDSVNRDLSGKILSDAARWGFPARPALG